MARLEITDEDRARARFAALMAETMTAVGAEPEKAPAPTRISVGRKEAAGIVAGLFLAGALIVLIGRVAPDRPADTPTSMPTATALPAPVVAPLPTVIPPTEAPTEIPPTPEPAIVYVEVAPPCDPANPPYVVRQDVYKGAVPLGIVTGTSCESQAAAQANADALAAEMRGE